MRKSSRNWLAAALFALVPAGAYPQAGSGGSAWQESYTLEHAGKYPQAAAVLETLLRDSPNHEFAMMRRGWLNYLQGKYNDALRDYNQVLALNPRSLEARLGLTLPLLAQQRWKEAATEARKVIAVSPWDYTAHVRLMVCEEGEKDWAGLSRHAAELAQRYPSDATGLVYHARAEASLGNKAKARAAYVQVLERYPSHVEANTYLKANP